MRKLGCNLFSKEGMEVKARAMRMRELGFDSAFCDGWEITTAAAYRQVGEALAAAGLAWECIHASFARINDLWRADEAGDGMLRRLLHEVDLCADSGARTLMVHVSDAHPAPCPPTDAGRARFDRLVDHAARRNVRLAVENLTCLSQVSWAMDTYRDAPHVGFCWDVGHEFCKERVIHYMPLYGDRLFCTHLHDNMRQPHVDNHRIPFDGRIDYGYVADQLCENGYAGTLMLEVFDHGFYANLTCEEFLSRAAAAAARLRTMMDG